MRQEFEPPTRVSIGIVTRNRAEVLPRSIESILLQKHVSIRLSVIDDGSDDATPDIKQLFPSLQWIRWSKSRGYLAARNFWISSALEEYFLGLDDDAWFVEGDEVALALDCLERDGNIAAIGFDILSPDRSNSQPRRAPETAAMFVGCGHMLRLSAVRDVGGYVQSPGKYGGEEKDLCLRLMDAGHKIIKLPGVHVWHDKSPLARVLPEQHCSGVCNDLTMTLRRTPLLLLPLALVAKIFRHFRFALRNQLVGPCLRGFNLFLRSIARVWQSRRPVKASTLRAFVRLSRSHPV